MAAAGIHIKSIAANFRRVEVSMKLRPWTRNRVGTHYGGSLYSMTDPFYMLMLMEILGRDYIVWDKAASIRFRRPGKGTVKAIFELNEEKINEIRAAVEGGEKMEPVFLIQIKNEQNELVADVEKTLYIKKKLR